MFDLIFKCRPRKEGACQGNGTGEHQVNLHSQRDALTPSFSGKWRPTAPQDPALAAPEDWTPRPPPTIYPRKGGIRPPGTCEDGLYEEQTDGQKQQGLERM